ncbi:hypothetical protein [Actinomadura mexicana]|uniref:Uncharacterized protein n=1 Tax=Actinomadura mexicana TaxID=134959 RepID=A0A239EEZ0_9ACTN|nr:hypothetical protein [Actinomadura mexicana]SNS43350.1 hypothetical protein SAMN06265355_11752 [Actinomadura mexicana]
MRPDIAALVGKMARREAGAALRAAPRVEFGREGPSVRVRLVACPSCGARPRGRDWSPPFRDGAPPGPVLRMLACETVTARALLPIITSVGHAPGLRRAEFETRGLTWLEAAPLGLGPALEMVDEAERWVTDPAGARGRTLPASTRRHGPGPAWPDHRERLVPSFLSPHPAVPPELELLYAQELRAAIAHGYEQAQKEQSLL